MRQEEGFFGKRATTFYLWDQRLPTSSAGWEGGVAVGEEEGGLDETLMGGGGEVGQSPTD